MQLLILALFLSLYLHDESLSLIRYDVSPWWLGAWVVGAKLAWVGLYALACRRTAKRLAQGGAAVRLRRLEMAGALFRVGVFALFLSDLHLGLLEHIREAFYRLTDWVQPILIDEMLAMLPTVALWGLGWCAYYPVERRLREAAILRQFDRGQPIYPIWSRRQYVLAQYRYQVLLILVPLLAVMAWTESVEVLTHQGRAWFPPKIEYLWVLAGCLGIFLIAPAIIRLTWDTVPMPDGEVREHLLNMCKRHRVRIGELLLWRTYGGMINAAVMGFVAPIRYILITDGLLQQMSRPHVEAVMAHELAHVRKKHMFWLLLSALAWMGVAEITALVFLTSYGLDEQAINQLLSVPVDETGAVLAGSALSTLSAEHLLLLCTLAGAVLLWAAGFGWVSRRAERQADSFAVAHLAAERGDDTINAADAQTMINALQHVADLNHVRADKHSWRHGSIRWRQDYLRTLAGTRTDKMGIDRLMRRVSIASLAVFVLVVILNL